MTDADFLRAVIAAPDDDTPRLAYADWLDDRGAADRAEFIRLQIRRGGGLTPDEAVRLAELLRTRADAWKVPGVPGSQTFDRGFVAGLSMAAEEFLRHADRLGEAAPITRVRLVVGHDRAAQLAAVPWLRRVQSLDLSNSFFGSRGRLGELFNTPWPKLHSLLLRNNSLWPETAAPLTAAAGQMPVLRHLDLSGNRLADDGVAELAAADSLAGLEELVLRCDEVAYSDSIHAAGMHRLAESGTLTRLTKLDLTGQYTGDAGLAAIANSTNARSLIELRVGDTEVGLGGTDAGIESVCHSDNFGRLKRLDLSRSQVGAEAGRSLSAWPRVAEMEWIDLRGCEFPAGAAALRNHPLTAKFLLDQP